jgi:hypothetical protein
VEEGRAREREKNLLKMCKIWFLNNSVKKEKNEKIKDEELKGGEMGEESRGGLSRR